MCTHMHQKYHHGIISPLSSTSSQQPLTIKPNHISQCLLSPVCISRGVALQLTTPSCLRDQSASLDHTYLFTDFSASHSVLTRTTHRDRSGVEVPKAGLNQMTQWLGRSGEARRRVSEETNCRVWSLRPWRMLGGWREGLHSTNSHCSIPERKWELVLTSWEEELLGFFFFFRFCVWLIENNRNNMQGECSKYCGELHSHKHS